jgi:hypothetical protein
MDTPVRPMGQPRPHYSLVNYLSSEDDFVTVLVSDEDENESDGNDSFENDSFENDSFEEEGVEDECFGQACQSFMGDYSPFADDRAKMPSMTTTISMKIMIRDRMPSTTAYLLMRISIRGKILSTTTVCLSMRILIRDRMLSTTPVYLPMISNLLPYLTPIVTMNNRDTGQIFHHLQKAHILLQMKPVPPSIALRQCMDMWYQ